MAEIGWQQNLLKSNRHIAFRWLYRSGPSIGTLGRNSRNIFCNLLCDSDGLFPGPFHFRQDRVHFAGVERPDGRGMDVAFRT